MNYHSSVKLNSFSKKFNVR